jgi:hypothetical protein
MPWVWHHDPPIGTGQGCIFCQAETDRAIEEFQEAVARNEYDQEGYTPAERRLQQRRRAL